MKLIVQPDDGVTPLVQAVKNAKKTIDIVIFRFDRLELEKALEAAVARGVVVRALIAHTNRGGEKLLRKLELRLLDAGVTVARTADDLPRYHGKMMVVDDTLHVFGFNYTQARHREEPQFRRRHRRCQAPEGGERPVRGRQHASALQAGTRRAGRQPRECSRGSSTEFIKKAKKELLIYDAKVSDRLMLRLLAERAKAGVEIRMFGKLGKGAVRYRGAKAARSAPPRAGDHARRLRRPSSAARACASWSSTAAARSASSCPTNAMAKKMRDVFEADWALTPESKEAEAAAGKEKEKKKEEKESEKATSGA